MPCSVAYSIGSCSCSLSYPHYYCDYDCDDDDDDDDLPLLLLQLLLLLRPPGYNDNDYEEDTDYSHQNSTKHKRQAGGGAVSLSCLPCGPKQHAGESSGCRGRWLPRLQEALGDVLAADGNGAEGHTFPVLTDLVDLTVFDFIFL